MIDYSTWTELQIQQAVLRATNGQCLHPFRFLGHAVSDIPLSAYNPCERVADAWSIIVNNGISIINDRGVTSTATNDSYLFSHEQFDDCLYHSHTNPLRAAMIVFLMTQEQN